MPGVRPSPVDFVTQLPTTCGATLFNHRGVQVAVSTGNVVFVPEVQIDQSAKVGTSGSVAVGNDFFRCGRICKSRDPLPGLKECRRSDDTHAEFSFDVNTRVLSLKINVLPAIARGDNDQNALVEGHLGKQNNIGACHQSGADPRRFVRRANDVTGTKLSDGFRPRGEFPGAIFNGDQREEVGLCFGHNPRNASRGHWAPIADPVSCFIQRAQLAQDGGAVVWVGNLREFQERLAFFQDHVGLSWHISGGRFGPWRQGKSFPLVIQLIKIFMTSVIREVNHTNVGPTATEELIAFINQFAIQFWIAINVIAAVVGEQTRTVKD